MVSLPKKSCKTFAILGTAGIGKSSMLLVVLKSLFEDPAKFGLLTRSFYIQTRDNKIRQYHHDSGDSFSVRPVLVEEDLDATIPLFADMENQDTPTEHSGMSLIFSSSRYQELTKMGWRKIMPTWSADEQAVVFNSAQFRKVNDEQVVQRAYENLFYFGGAIRSNILSAKDGQSASKLIDNAILKEGSYVCEHYFSAGLCGLKDSVSDLLVHRNPEKVEGVYDFDAVAFSFASPYVLRRLMVHNSMLVTAFRNKFNGGTFRDGADGNEFEIS